MTATKKSFFAKLKGQVTLKRGVSAILIFLVIWHVGALFDDWFGVDIIGIGLVQGTLRDVTAESLRHTRPHPAFSDTFCNAASQLLFRMDADIF